MNYPEVNHKSFWKVYREMLQGLEELAAEHENIRLTVDSHAVLLIQMNTNGHPINSMELLPNQQHRNLKDPVVGHLSTATREEDLELDSDVPHAVFSSDEEEDV